MHTATIVRDQNITDLPTMTMDKMGLQGKITQFSIERFALIMW